MSQQFDRLHEVLEEWQPRLEPSAGFDAALRRRIAAPPTPRPWFARTWTRVAAAATLAGGLGLFVFLAQNQPEMPAPEPAQAAVVRDLQVLNNNAELIEHLDFLTQPANPPAGEEN